MYAAWFQCGVQFCTDLCIQQAGVLTGCKCFLAMLGIYSRCQTKIRQREWSGKEFTGLEAIGLQSFRLTTKGTSLCCWQHIRGVYMGVKERRRQGLSSSGGCSRDMQTLSVTVLAASLPRLAFPFFRQPPPKGVPVHHKLYCVNILATCEKHSVLYLAEELMYMCWRVRREIRPQLPSLAIRPPSFLFLGAFANLLQLTFAHAPGVAFSVDCSVFPCVLCLPALAVTPRNGRLLLYAIRCHKSNSSRGLPLHLSMAPRTQFIPFTSLTARAKLI
eukprot:1157775-Pelagomonas_calceolata.AAC.3